MVQMRWGDGFPANEENIKDAFLSDLGVCLAEWSGSKADVVT